MNRRQQVHRRNNDGLRRHYLFRLQQLLGLFALGIVSRDHFCVAFSSARIGHAINGKSVPSMSLSSSRAASTSIFSKNRMQNNPSRKTSNSALNMVLSTPMDIIEQASTVNLLDDLIDESVRTSSRRPIIRQFDPSSGWIWRRWKGTIFSETWVSCVRNMLYAVAIFLLYKAYPNIIDNHLKGFNTLWGQLLSVTTFTLTFFVNQSYSLWRKCTQLSRRLQGRLHDIGMNMATHAQRKTPEKPDEASTYTPEARQILVLMSRYVRMFNLMCYASFTRSHRPLITPVGMRRLVERGLLTPMEREALVEAAIPPTQRHSAILMWMIRLFIEGRASGHIGGGDGFEQHTMDKFHIIRAQYGAIGDELQGRMPLAYAHIVQVLVDAILWMYPVMAFTIGMSPFLVIAGTGMLTISYQGLFDLAKQFLDPYDNENYGKGEDPLVVDTLIAETNAGSVRWLYGFEEMPFNAEQLNQGELYDTLLPVRGYSAEDVAQMEEDRLKKEMEKEEERAREEEEKLKREAKEAREDEGKVESKQIEESADDDDDDEEECIVFPEAQQTISESSNATECATVELVSGSPDVTVSVIEPQETIGIVKPIHKVTTVGGLPKSFSKVASEDELFEKARTKSNGNVEVANYLASLSPTEGNGTSPEKVGQEEITMVTDDSVNTDGKSLCEAQAEEEEQEEEVESIYADTDAKQKMSDDEYNRKLAKIEKAINALNLSPESDGMEEIQLLAEKKKKKKKKTVPKVEDIEEELEEEPKPRMTLEDYEVEVERIITEAKEEMLETEAILSTKSGLDPLDWDYDDEQLESIAYEGDEEEEEDDEDKDDKASEEIVKEEDLVVLEMDVDEEIGQEEEIDPQHLADIEKTLEILNLRPGLSAVDPDETEAPAPDQANDANSDDES